MTPFGISAGYINEYKVEQFYRDARLLRQYEHDADPAGGHRKAPHEGGVRMTMSDIHNGSAVIILDNPPVNSLGHALRERIVQRLDAALADTAVRAIVRAGNEKAFSAGADVTEFGKS
nr:enoyl-CoA hydratase [uncultured bacterium]